MSTDNTNKTVAHQKIADRLETALKLQNSGRNEEAIGICSEIIDKAEKMFFEIAKENSFKSFTPKTILVCNNCKSQL